MADDWCRNQPVHTGSEKRQPPSDFQPEKVLTYYTWLNECETLPTHSSSSSPSSSTAVLSQPSHYLQSQRFDRNEFLSLGKKVKRGVVCPLRASFYPRCLIQQGAELQVAKSIFPYWLNHGYDCQVNSLIGEEKFHRVLCSDGEGGKHSEPPCPSVIAFASQSDSVKLKITSVSPVCVTGAHFLILSKSNRRWHPPSLNIHLGNMTRCIHLQLSVWIYLSQLGCFRSNK